MARQTEKERQLLMARKKVGYEELVAVEKHEDVDMVDVEMGEARMVDADEAAGAFPIEHLGGRQDTASDSRPKRSARKREVQLPKQQSCCE